ncbi:MAG TPA: SDR family oxidoreductase, partial [Terriglobales bacterium]|nr:SDR family oxidoreductase [Terriglobales bacterium]
MHENKSLSGQVGIVTGGGRGIGAAIAAKLAELGAATVICGRSPSTLENTAQHIRAAGHRCEPMECDVTSLASVEKLAARVEQTFGRADILVNNAGVGGFATPLHELPPVEWDRTLNTNLRGVYYMIRCFVPLMIRT